MKRVIHRLQFMLYRYICSVKAGFIFIFFLHLFLFSEAQNDSAIHINGRVYDPLTANPDLNNFMIVNMRTQQGMYGKANGTFSIDALRTDTIVVAVIGYEFIKYCFRDSLQKSSYDIAVRLKQKEVRLPEVRIMAPRDLEAIQRDIQKLGYNKKDYELSGVNALESPITFLYEEFSRTEQLKRHNAQIVNDDKKRNLLKELLSRWVADSIIKLDDNEFDRFVDFCNVSEYFMKNSTQYDFMVYIKRKYEMFEGMKDYYRPDYFRVHRSPSDDH